MKKLRDIRRDIHMVRIVDASRRGGFGIIRIGSYLASVAWGADEDGWEHVSVSPEQATVTPTWDDMCEVKDVFWDEEEAVLQIHPPRSKYVNLTENCLHLWRPKDGIHGMNPEWDEK